MKRTLPRLLPLLLLLSLHVTLSGCQSRRTPFEMASGPARNMAASERIGWLQERDHIAMLAAYSIVFVDWQPFNERGRNSGAVLVDRMTPDGRLVFWSRNRVNETDNPTETEIRRLLLGYIEDRNRRANADRTDAAIMDLAGFSVYTTLEPDAFSAGMITQLEIFRVVYGQEDTTFGRALDRLSADTTALVGGYPPYVFPVLSVRTDLDYANQLDGGYPAYRKERDYQPGLEDYLQSEEARYIFQAAYNRFLSYQAAYPENITFLAAARDMVEEARN